MWTWAFAGHDLDSLLYNFMDEFLYRFSVDGVVVCDVHVESIVEGKKRVTSAVSPKSGSAANTLSLTCYGYGEIFDRKKHGAGTEIKAITFSNMQILRTPQKTDVYVIVDI